MEKSNKGKTIVAFIILIFVVTGIGFGIWWYLAKYTQNFSYDSVTKWGKKSEEEKETSGDQNTSNEFDLSTVKAGDKVAGMIITSVKPFSQTLCPSGNLPLSVTNASVEFSGRTTITGTYTYIAPGEPGMFGEFISFEVTDSASLVKLPKIKGDDKNIWFSFEDLELAKKLLGLGEKGTIGTVTIIIDNYVINNYPSEVFNTTALIKVVE